MDSMKNAQHPHMNISRRASDYSKETHFLLFMQDAVSCHPSCEVRHFITQQTSSSRSANGAHNMGDDSNAKLNFKSEGTLIQENDKTYWFPGTTGLKGVLVPSGHGLDLVEGIVGRKLSADEFTLLFAMPLDGSKSVTIVSTLVSDPAEPNYLKSLKHEVIGYIVSVRENAAKHNYGDTIGTDGFYDTNGKLQGLSTLTERKEPGLETPLLDPIDFVGGAVVDLAKAGVKMFGAAAARTLTRSIPVRTTLSKALRTITADEVELGSKQLAKRPPTVQEFRKFMASMTRGEEAVGERVGGRVAALDKGRGARPFYHKDPKLPGKGPPWVGGEPRIPRWVWSIPQLPRNRIPNREGPREIFGR
jgi:hypothetical protein